MSPSNDELSRDLERCERDLRTRRLNAEQTAIVNFVRVMTKVMLTLRQVRPPEDEAGRMRIAAGYGSKSSAELDQDLAALNETVSLDGLPDNLRPMLQEFRDMTKLAVASRANPAVARKIETALRWHARGAPVPALTGQSAGR